MYPLDQPELSDSWALATTLAHERVAGAPDDVGCYLLEDDFDCWLLNASTSSKCRAARPTWPTRCGLPSWSSTVWPGRRCAVQADLGVNRVVVGGCGGSPQYPRPRILHPALRTAVNLPRR